MGENAIQISDGITINADDCNKRHVHEKHYFWNPCTRNRENGKHLANTINDCVIMCNEVTASYDGKIKTIPTSFNEEKTTCKTQICYILLAFLFIAIAFLIVVSIYCYLIKH